MIDPRVERAQKGDAAALEELLASIAPAVRRFGLRMCKNPPDADDVLQDTLLAIATHLPEYEGRSSLTSWVFALTRSACARRRRGLKNRPPESDDDARLAPDEGPSPEDRAASRELGDVLARALDALPDEQREVVLLRDMEGLTAPETADAIGVSVEAVKSRLHRARAALRASLAPKIEAPKPGCPDVAAQWSRDLEGDLAAADCAAMEKHIATCEACAKTCDVLKGALAACRAATSEALPRELADRIRAAARKCALASPIRVA